MPLVILTILVAAAIWYLAIDDDRPPDEPQETTTTLELVGPSELAARYRMQGFSCTNEDVVDTENAVMECTRVVSGAAVVVRLRGQAGLLPFSVADVTIDSRKEAVVSAGSKAALLPFANSAREASTGSSWVRDHFDRARARTSIGALRLQLRPSPSRIQLLVRGWQRAGIITLPAGETVDDLAQRFAPILRFATDEPFYPLDVEGYLAESELCYFRPRKDELERIHCKQAPPFDQLPTERPACFDCFRALDVRGAEEHEGEAVYQVRDGFMRSNHPGNVVYYALRPIAPQRSVLQYWMFYAFNKFDNSHEGDWEMIGIDLDHRGDRSIPVRVAYSAHHGSLRKDWTALVEGKQRVADQPIVYIARGSHANYTASGHQRGWIEVWSWAGRRLCYRITDETDNHGIELDPDDYTLKPLGGPAFEGAYGPGNYVFGELQEPGKPATKDPRASPRWLEPFRLVATIDKSRC